MERNSSQIKATCVWPSFAHYHKLVRALLYAVESGEKNKIKNRNGGWERKRKSEKRQPGKCEPPAELKKRGEELITHLFFSGCSAPERRHRECKASHFFICVIWIFFPDLKQRRERDLSRLVGCESFQDSIFWYSSAVCLFFILLLFSHRFSPFCIHCPTRRPRPKTYGYVWSGWTWSNLFFASSCSPSRLQS